MKTSGKYFDPICYLSVFYVQEKSHLPILLLLYRDNFEGRIP